MVAKKLAISLPEEVLERVDAAAARRGMSRSGFIASVLRRVAAAHSDAEVSKRVDELFADPSIAVEQRETAAAYRSAGSS